MVEVSDESIRSGGRKCKGVAPEVPLDVDNRASSHASPHHRQGRLPASKTRVEKSETRNHHQHLWMLLDFRIPQRLSTTYHGRSHNDVGAVSRLIPFVQVFVSFRSSMKHLQQQLKISPTAVASKSISSLVLKVGWRASPVVRRIVWLEGNDAGICGTHLVLPARWRSSVGALWQCFTFRGRNVVRISRIVSSQVSCNEPDTGTGQTRTLVVSSCLGCGCNKYRWQKHYGKIGQLLRAT